MIFLLVGRLEVACSHRVSFIDVELYRIDGTMYDDGTMYRIDVCMHLIVLLLLLLCS